MLTFYDTDCKIVKESSRSRAIKAVVDGTDYFYTMIKAWLTCAYIYVIISAVPGCQGGHYKTDTKVNVKELSFGVTLHQCSLNRVIYL